MQLRSTAPAFITLYSFMYSNNYFSKSIAYVFAPLHCVNTHLNIYFSGGLQHLLMISSSGGDEEQYLAGITKGVLSIRPTSMLGKALKQRVLTFAHVCSF